MTGRWTDNRYTEGPPQSFRERDSFNFFFMAANDPLRSGQFGPKGMVGRINVEDHQTLLHTKSVSSGPHSFREEDF